MDTPIGILSPIPSMDSTTDDPATNACDAQDVILRTMGACTSYPNCMASFPTDEDALRPGTRRPRPSQTPKRPIGAALYSMTADTPDVRTFDLEELGLLHLRAEDADAVTKGVEVDYEDGEGAGGIPHRDRRVIGTQQKRLAACAPDACQPLDSQSVDTLDAAVAASSSASSRRGKHVVVKEAERPKKEEEEEDEKRSTSATDNEEEDDDDERCCKIHKLCMCELRRHRSMDDCWLVAYGKVYNVTGIMRAHPGGTRCLLRKAGGPDCAQDMDFHTKKARRMMDKCFIGKLEPCGEVDAAGQTVCSIM